MKHGRSDRKAQPTTLERVAPQTGKSGWPDLNRRLPAPKRRGRSSGSSGLRGARCAGDARVLVKSEFHPFTQRVKKPFDVLGRSSIREVWWGIIRGIIRRGLQHRRAGLLPAQRAQSSPRRESRLYGFRLDPYKPAVRCPGRRCRSNLSRTFQLKPLPCLSGRLRIFAGVRSAVFRRAAA